MKNRFLKSIKHSNPQDPAKYRLGLPMPMPHRIYNLPVHQEFKVPTPWFAAETSPGKWDLRVVDPKKIFAAIGGNRCWVCGKPIDNCEYTFTIGPMCAINKVTTEPPAHYECAEWSTRACPALNHTQSQRRKKSLPNHKQPAGIGFEGLPQVSVLWQTTYYDVENLSDGIILKIGEPTAPLIWRQGGKNVSRDVAAEALQAGFQQLFPLAQAEGKEAVDFLSQSMIEAINLLPGQWGVGDSK